MGDCLEKVVATFKLTCAARLYRAASVLAAGLGVAALTTRRRPYIDCFDPANDQKTRSSSVIDLRILWRQYRACGRPRSLSNIRFGFFSSMSCRVMSSKPLRRKKRNSCGNDQGMMCMWVPCLIRPTRHGKPGKKPRRKN